MSLLSVSSELADGRSRLAVRGELDLSTVGQVETALAELERESGASTVVLDLRGLRFIDSSGLHLVLGADARARECGGRLLIVRGPEAVDRVFRLARLEQRLELTEDPDPDPDADPRARETSDA